MQHSGRDDQNAVDTQQSCTQAAEDASAGHDSDEPVEGADTSWSPPPEQREHAPEDAPPDDAIGQQRGDMPPICASDAYADGDRPSGHSGGGASGSGSPNGNNGPGSSSSGAGGSDDPGNHDHSAACAGMYSMSFAPNQETLMRRALTSFKPKTAMNHAAFARLIATRLDTTFALEREDKENLIVQWFDLARGVWVRGGGARRLHDVATEILYDTFSQELTEEQMAIFGNKGFISPVVDLLKNFLPRAQEMPPLDGDVTRGLLRFSCGRVLDFRTGELRPGRASDRISQSTGYAYQEWDAPPATRASLAELCARLNEFWDGGCDDVTEHCQERLEGAVRDSTLYRIIYGLFEDHNVALWLLRQSVRAVAGLPGYEEVLFLVDRRGSNGKGTWLAIIKAVLGIENGYYATLEYEKHFVGSGMAQKNINNPDIAALAGKRFVAVNESPESSATGALNVTLIKRLACGGDDPLTATAKYKDPTAFQPQCLLAFCANNDPEFPARDGGFKSRVSYVNMPFEWVADPQTAGQRKIDVSIKERVVRSIQPEFLFWAVHLAPGLLRHKARVILPRPAKVQYVAMQFAQGVAAPAEAPEVLGRACVDACVAT